MSLKDLFKEQKNLKSAEPLSKEDFKDEIESFDYAAAINKRDARFVAIENFANPSFFARFGLAEKYYEDSIKRIHDTYPYDGSLKEKVLWEVSSSLVDLYLFENGYPRTTGYANFLYGASDTGAEGTYFYPPVNEEYIYVKGGPHAGSGNALYYNQITDNVVYRKDANVYDLENNQESNLLIDGTKGNTVEFWLKKSAFVANQDYFEFILDTHVTGTSDGDADYGRLVVALATTGTTANGNNQPIYVTYASGSDVIRTYLGNSNLTTASIADGDWHHYAVRMKTSGNDTVFDLFVDGEHNDTTTEAGTTVGYVSGAIVATIGSQAAVFNDGRGDYGDKGWSTFSGSIDEFRYWKRWRTAKQIQTRWFDQVGGGTNTDLSNTDLGVYFKFNEGITQTSSIDATVLDYSGRVSNGTWTGYSSSSRSTGSAILESNASTIEFKDPIIYDFHPDVISYLSSMSATGSLYDDTNANSLKSYIPGWILEQSETERDNLSGNYLLNLLQVISSYFDEASILLDKLPELNHNKYYTGDTTPPPFNKKSLESVGFINPEIFVDASLLEKFEDRDQEIKFERSLQEVKNVIYQNIHNNLNYIYKSKGTEKSFRNLLRCFGIGDNVLKINLYGDNAVYKLEDNLKLITRKTNYINFNEIGNNDGSVYQYKIDDNSTSFISGTSATDGTYEGAGLSFTLESNVILPNRVSIGEYSTVKQGYDDKVANLYPLHVDSCLFGVHSANGVENDLTWAANDYANFQVITVKDDKYSSNAYFKLSSTAGGVIPELTSSIFNDVYDDQLWSISVTVEPTKKESANGVSGSADTTYNVRFYGVSHIADYKANEFLVTGTITNDQGRKFLSSPKRVFIGAHRTNFTGSIIDFADTKVESCKAWYSSIPTGTIDNHNLKIGNYGAEKPTQNAFLYQDSINDKFVPQAQTLALLWEFSTLSASNSNGQFAVEDISSGSAGEDRYGWFSDLVSRRHTASGSFFLESSSEVIESLERSTYQAQVPEVLLDSNLTRILSQDDEYFDRNTRPTTYHLSIEKNLFQDISEEMLNMFGSVVWFNNMIGTPVNMYRGEYKELKKAADLFFEKVGNDYDFDKYVEYFKFIDYAVSRYLVKLIPMSMMTFEDGISTVIENFVLGDRNKYKSQYPLIKDVKTEPQGNILAINELSYDWKTGHPPVSNDQSDNCNWFKERSERANPTISSGDSTVDSNRQDLLDKIVNETNASAPTLYDITNSQTYLGSTYATRRLAKPYKVKGINKPDIHGGGNFYQNKRVGFLDSIRKRPTPSGATEGALISIEPTDSKLEPFKDCDDNLDLNKGKRKYSFSAGVAIDGAAEFSKVYKGDMVFPFSLYSSSVTGNPAMSDLADFQANLAITNLHHDNYGDFADVPMQGPFTEKYVGGRSYRHVMTNFTPDNAVPDSEGERLEGWRLTASADSLDLVNPNSPRSVYFREEYAKRPVNIKNIKQLTSSANTDDQATDASGVTKIGNYTETYEVVMTNGRSINNRYMAESDGLLPTDITDRDSTFVSGIIDFTLPRRDLTGSNKGIIVNRFSAPGDIATMTEGMMDIAAAEYSAYNALPFRNLSVRMPLNELHSDHTNQFGYFSDQFTVSAYELAGAAYPGGSSSVNLEDYSGTGSFHKVNRNGRQAVRFSGSTGYSDDSYVETVKYDNWFIQHAIPQTDVQYAWITASLVEDYSGSALYDYESKGLGRGDFASSDLVFVSASNIGSYIGSFPTVYRKFGAESGTSFIVSDFIGINTNIVEPINLHFANTIGLTATPAGGRDEYLYLNPTFIPQRSVASNYPYVLQGLLSHRGGPAGGANWKLYRKDNHPIVRYQRNHNQIGYLQENLFIKSDSTIKNFTEPPITSKYKPLIYKVKTSDQPSVTTALGSLGNIHKHFTDHTRESKLSPEYSGIHLDYILPLRSEAGKIFNQTYSPYTSFLNYFDYNNYLALRMIEVSYAETIYPKALYTYLSGTRKRINFTNDFWRDRRDDRTKNDLVNSMSEVIETSSIWKLDAHIDFSRDESVSGAYIPYSGGMTQEDGVGELQNCYSLFHYGTASNIVPAVNYNRRIKLLHHNRVEISRDTSTEFYDARENLGAPGYPIPRFADLTNSSFPSRFSASVGDTLWEVSSNDNYKPFYDSYDEYAEEGFRNLKDGTILPEFRISEKMNDYLAAMKTATPNYNNYNPSSFFAVAVDPSNNSGLQIQSGLLSLTGAATYNSTEEFLNRYVFSDFYDYFKLVEEDYEDKITIKKQVRTTRHKLTCEAMLKFLPYNGFYPSERTAQLGQIFSESINRLELEGSDANLRTAMQPYFAPGILYNSIKSGIAVDYPIFDNASDFSSVDSVCWGTAISGNFSKRIPFGELIEPSQNNLIVDAEVDPDFAINSTASFQSTTSNHTFAMSNFLAASMDLFIGRDSEEQGMIKANIPNTKDGDVVIGEDGVYAMSINLFNSTNITTYSDYVTAAAKMRSAEYANTAGARFLTSSLQVNNLSVTMYSRAITGYDIDPFLYGSSFGPPVETGELSEQDGFAYTSTGLTGSAFDPFTPAYYNGFGNVTITIPLTVGVTTREDIFASASYTYTRLRTLAYPVSGNNFTEAYNAAAETTNFKYSMQLSSSLFLGDESEQQVIYESRPELNIPRDSTETTIKQVVAFKPRWESPVLDFSNITPTESFVSGNVAKGMWHQYGEIPERLSGIKLLTQAGPDINSSYKDLASLLNINTNQISKIGKINQSSGINSSKNQKREFSEAIIAIPFKYKKNLDQTILYRIDKKQVNLIKDNLYTYPEDRYDPLTPYNIRSFDEIEQLTTTNTETKLRPESEDLYNLMMMMRKYVLPPHFDFLHNDSVSPFVMFMMEYSIALTQKDLQNIWQNVEPTFARRALKIKNETNMHLMPTTLTQRMQPNTGENFPPYHPYFAPTDASSVLDGLSNVFDPAKTRWAVFKVKKRAAMNYNSIVGKIRQDDKEYIRQDLGIAATRDFLYSYNWPNDFFSLIELAKINSITTFNPNYSEEE